MNGFYRSWCGIGNGFTRIGWIGGVAVLIGIVLVGVIIYLLVRNNRQGARSNQDGYGYPSGSDDRTAAPEKILKERLAKGEIDEETFDRLMQKLK